MSTDSNQGRSQISPEAMISGALSGTLQNDGSTDNSGDVKTNNSAPAGKPTDSKSKAEDNLEDQDDLDEGEDEEDVEGVEDDTDVEVDDEDDDSDAGDPERDYLYHDDEEGKEIFLKAVDPETGEKSVYLNRTEAQQGLQRQLKYIGEQKQQLTKLQEETEQKIAQLTDELNLFRKNLTTESAKEMLIRAKMPENLQALDPTEIVDEDDLRAWKKAHLDAELQLEREIAEEKAKIAERTRAQKEKAKAAHDYITSRISKLSDFGLTNSEDQLQARELLKSTPVEGGRTILQMAELIAEEFGNDMADRFIKGVISDIGNQRKAEVVEKAKKVKTNIKTKKRKTTTTPKPVQMDARSMIAAGLSGERRKR
jgi:hypothetical protein